MADRHQSPSYPLRLPADLKELVTQAAAEMGRSFNAEIAARLQSSFEFDYTGLPFAVVQAVEDVMAEKGLSQEDALTQLVLAGQVGNGTVLNLRITPGTTAKQVRDALNEALKHIPPDSNVVSTRAG